MYLSKTQNRQPDDFSYLTKPFLTPTVTRTTPIHNEFKEVPLYRNTQCGHKHNKPINPLEPTVRSVLKVYCKKFSKKRPKSKKAGRNNKEIDFSEDTKKETVGRKRVQKFTGKLWIEELPDIYWPTVPGVDGPEEESAEPVGNLMKPPPRDPEEEEKYKNLYIPTEREMYEQFQQWPPVGIDFDDDVFLNADEFQKFKIADEDE